LTDKTVHKYPPPLESYTKVTGTAHSCILTLLRQEIMEEYMYNRFGDNGLLVSKTLLKKPYIDEKELLKLTLLDKKQLGQALNSMIQNGLVMFYEVKVDRVATILFYTEE
jgi:DNA-binding MarR family transcriptional regulator